ncbi:MAG TPA: galactokinase family protein [Gemmatimonadaceae bacterium]
MTIDADEKPRATGMGEEPVAGLSARFTALEASLHQLSGSRSDRALRYWVPGRIEVLGKHTDYAGGRSLLCAVKRGICMLAVPRDDNHFRILDARSMELAEYEIGPELAGQVGHWSNYPATVARRIARDFPTLVSPRGADMVFESNIPLASGMSSSSALVVASFLALSDANELSTLPEFTRDMGDDARLAGYLGAVENGWSYGALAGDSGVGTFGGSEDHTAILCARPGALVQYSFCPVRLEREVALPAGYSFAVGVSGVRAQKTGAARERYNRASRATSLIADIWRRDTQRADPTLAAAITSSSAAPGRLRDILRGSAPDDTAFTASELLARLEHFITESEEIVPEAAESLARGRLSDFGALVDRSQERAERLLGNQIDQTVDLARTARELGAAAASAFGAGFGGSVWALVRSEDAEEFLHRWEERHRKKYPDSETAGRGVFFATSAGPAAMRIQ